MDTSGYVTKNCKFPQFFHNYFPDYFGHCNYNNERTLGCRNYIVENLPKDIHLDNQWIISNHDLKHPKIQKMIKQMKKRLREIKEDDNIGNPAIFLKRHQKEVFKSWGMDIWQPSFKFKKQWYIEREIK